MMFNSDGRRRGSIVGYAASRSSESYSSEQQVVEFRSSSTPRVSSPKKIMDYKDPETFSRGSPFLVPWSSPRAGNDDHPTRNPSPPNYGNNDRRVVFQEFSPRKASSPNYGNNDRRVVQEFSPRKASSPNYGKSSEQRFHGNKQDYYSSNYKGYDDSEYDEEEEEEDDAYYDGGLKGKNRVHVRDDHIMEDMKQGKSSHYDSSSGKSKHNQGINSYNNINTHGPPYDNGKYYKGNEYSSSPRNSNYGAGPFSNKPKKETNYYEPSSHGGPIGNNTNNGGLAPIKTRPNYSNRVTDYPDEAERTKNTNPKATQQPKFNSSAGSKDQRETIDSNEARRRYGRSSSRSGPTVEERYTNAIDSREAARRYKGVFVP